MFVPTHTLKHDIPSLNLKAGTPLRQINPFADGKHDHRLCLEEKDKTGVSWILFEYDLIPLPEWETIRRQMINEITKGGQ